MLQITNLTVSTKAKNIVILKDINLEFGTGKIYAISGQNGSGKSTLAQVIVGNPEYILSKESVLSFEPVEENLSLHQNAVKITGTPTFPPNIQSSHLTSHTDVQVTAINTPQQINITILTPDQRSHLGIFVSMQYPTEVPGVNFLSYLKLIIELNRKARGVAKLTSKQLIDLIHSKIEIIGWSKDILSRNLNEGLSGGERKKSEILQMLLLDPKLIILDEIDSGLDKQSLETIIKIIKKFMTKDKTLVVITHQQQILELLIPDRIIKIKDGKLV